MIKQFTTQFFFAAKILFLCCLVQPAKAQVNKIIPAWVKPIALKDVSPVNKKQIKDGYYYLLIDEQFNSIAKQSYFHYATCAITEEALTDVSQIEFSYDPSYQKAFLHSVKIHRGSEVIDKTSGLELKTLNEESRRNSGVLDGRKTLYANLSDVRKGDVVEYSFSAIGANPIMGKYFNHEFFLSYSVPVGKIFLRVVFPLDTKPAIVSKNTQLQPQIIQSAFNDYIWEISNPATTTSEGSVPSWYSASAKVQISNLASWNEVKNHCRSLFKLPAYNKAAIAAIVDSIIKTNKTAESQISSVVEFVQTHVRYSGNENGIYSHIPRTPDFVLKNRYGDCKEKSVLLNEMLGYLHIEAYPVLISTEYKSKTIDQAPSINAFDHCISAFFFDNQIYFIDPTISYQRGSFKQRIVPAYETGMVLDGKENTFTKIPTDQLSKTAIEEKFTIANSGDAKLDAISVYTGTDADDMRYYFLTNSIYDVQEEYKKFYSRFGDNIEVTDTVSYTDNTESNEFTTVEHYAFKKFWALADSVKSKTITRDFMPYALHFKLNYAQEPKRKDPLKISYPLSHTHTITVIKEGGWNVKNTVRKEDNKYFNYSYAHELKGSKLELAYSYHANTGIIEPGDYADYKSKMDFINLNMVFSAEEKPLTGDIMGFNWLLLVVILCALVCSLFLVLYLYKRPYYTPYAGRYDAIGGWLVLVGISVTVNPLVLLYGLYTQCNAEMDYNYANFYFSAESTYFSPIKGYFTLFVSFVNNAMFVFTILLLVLFYQKKSSFRLYYSLFRIFNTLFLVLNVIILHSYYSGSGDIDERTLLSKETSSMITVFIQTCVWVPYVWFSERSRHTFTRDNAATDTITPGVTGPVNNELSN